MQKITKMPLNYCSHDSVTIKLIGVLKLLKGIMHLSDYRSSFFFQSLLEEAPKRTKDMGLENQWTLSLRPSSPSSAFLGFSLGGALSST